MAGAGLFKLLVSSVGVAGIIGVDTLAAFKCTHALSNIIRLFAQQTSSGVVELLFQVSTELSPLSHTPPKGIDLYNGLITRLKKPIEVLIGLLLDVGQLQILRREFANQLKFACHLDSNLLFGALTNLNAAVLKDVRRHYEDAARFPYPAADNPLMPELAKHLEATGLHDPLSKVYITTEPQPHIALWLAIAVMQQMHRFAYDRDFDSLIRSKTHYEMDGAPLVLGLATFLKQLHPTVTRQVLAFLSQYVRVNIAASFASGGGKLNVDVVNTLLFIRQLGASMVIPQAVLERFVPAYVLQAAAIGL